MPPKGQRWSTWGTGRVTNLPGVTHGLPKTEVGALEAIRRYEAQNRDLPPSLRRLLALAAIGRYFGRRTLEQALGGARLPQAPFRDTGWRWWTVLYLSGLGDRWETWCADARMGGVRRAARTLRQTITLDHYLDFLRRAGTNPHNGKYIPKQEILWTKGGSWDTRSNLTTLLVQKQHLPPREFQKRWQHKLGPGGVLTIEKELMTLINPDVMLVHEAKQRAVQYVRRRIAELMGSSKNQMGLEAAAWFFMIPNGALKPDGVASFRGKKYPKLAFNW